jgi:hypothetical protein
MLHRFKRALPLAAVVSACVLAADIATLSFWKASQLTGADGNRSSVERALTGLEDMHPASLSDAALKRGLDRLLERPEVKTVWLFSPDGRVVFSEGSTAASTPLNSTVAELATDEAHRLLDVLPAEALSSEQRTWLLAASAIRREGTHNDVYRHMLRPIRGPEGSTVALIGVAYEFAEWRPGLVWVMAVIVALVSLVIYWLSLPTWVWLDARERGERALAWATFVLMGNLIGLLAYVLARVPRYVGSSTIE